MKPASPLPFEFCENGVKAVAWKLTAHRCTPAFFAKHTARGLRDWDDYQLERTGRLTHPLRYEAASDTYVPVSWGARAGGDLAALTGICKSVLARHDEGTAAGGPAVLDEAVLRDHTHSLATFVDWLRAQDWTNSNAARASTARTWRPRRRPTRDRAPPSPSTG